ncbi:MAG TPA: chemotaxis protein CheW [Verrucomicrobiae bacterium]|nr:chemotaxis protein CheW [Verrucomicrobiae bacterium]
MNETPASQPAVPPQTVAETANPLPALVDCWDKIGTAGDRSCGELEAYVHCRNCPVYSKAALELLNRPLSLQHRTERTEHYALPQKISALGKISVVIFRVSYEWLALPTQAFVEIAEHRKIHTIPHRRDGNLLGLVNIRGELVVCVSLGRLLELENTGIREKKLRTMYDRLVVVNWNSHRFVFPADEVYGIQRLQSSDVKDRPATLGPSSVGYTRGIVSWQNKTVGVLDAESVFAAMDRSLA